jgi:hypothetical protein
VPYNKTSRAPGGMLNTASVITPSPNYNVANDPLFLDHPMVQKLVFRRFSSFEPPATMERLTLAEEMAFLWTLPTI